MGIVITPNVWPWMRGKAKYATACKSDISRSFGIVRFIAKDSVFAKPNNYIIDKAIAYASSVMFGLGYEYKAESEDCDDFARMASALMRHYLTIIRPDAEASLSVGVALYRKDSGGNHAVITVVDIDDCVRFFEPQRLSGDAEIELSGSEFKKLYKLEF